MDKLRSAAIILLGIGEEHAANIMKHMTDEEIKLVIEAMGSIKTVTEVEVVNVLQEFINESVNVSSIDTASKEYLKNALTSAIGSKKANLMINDDSEGKVPSGIELLKWQAPHAVLDMLNGEHPQIIALILSYMSSKDASMILKSLPKEIRTDVVHRITYMGPVSSFAISTLSDFFEKQFANDNSYRMISACAGTEYINTAANIVSYLDSQTETEIISNLSGINKEVAEQIQDRIFPFERLATLDSKSLQTLLREVGSDDLAVSLKGVDPEVAAIFYKNMSSKAAEMLQEDIKMMGPVKLVKVIEGQKKIIQIAKQMASEEKIILIGSSQSDVVM